MSENNVTGIIGAEVTTTGIIGATVAIGQYIVNDYVITIAPVEDDYGYTMTITRGSDTQTVTLYGLSTEQYNSMLGYLQQAQEAAQNAAGSASDAYAYLELALDAANRANTQAARAEQASDTARSYASQAQTAKQGAETAKTDAQTARTQAQGYWQAAETAATRAGSAATRAETALAAAETAQSAAEAAQTAAEAAETDTQTYAGQASQSAANAAQSAASAAQTLAQVQAEGAAQIAAIDAEGQRVIDSIPEDYTEVVSDVADLKSQLTDSGLIEYVDFSDVVTDKYILYNGTEQSGANFSHTQPFEIKKGQTVVFTAKGYSTSIAMIAKHIGGTSYLSLVNSVDSEVRDYTYTATEDTNIVLSYNYNSTYNAVVFYEIDQIIEEQEAIENKLTKTVDFSDVVAGKFISSSGTEETSVNFSHTNPMILKKGETIIFKAKGYLTSVAMIASYNGGTSYTPIVTSIDSTVREYSYTANTDINIVLSYGVTASYSATISVDLFNLGTVGTMNNLFSIFETFGACGDSLISGTIEVASGNIQDAVTNYNLSWAKQLSNICKNDYTHYSFGGATTKTWLNTFSDSIASKDAYFVALGINDFASLSLGSASDIGTSADTFFRYYGDIIALLKATNAKAKIFVCSIYRGGSDVESWNSAIKYFADNNTNVYYLDFTNMSVDFGAFKNGSHFSAIGYRMIAVKVSGMIDTLMTTNYGEFRYVGT